MFETQFTGPLTWLNRFADGPVAVFSDASWGHCIQDRDPSGNLVINEGVSRYNKNREGVIAYYAWAALERSLTCRTMPLRIEVCDPVGWLTPLNAVATQLAHEALADPYTLFLVPFNDAWILVCGALGPETITAEGIYNRYFAALSEIQTEANEKRILSSTESRLQEILKLTKNLPEDTLLEEVCTYHAGTRIPEMTYDMLRQYLFRVITLVERIHTYEDEHPTVHALRQEIAERLRAVSIPKQPTSFTDQISFTLRELFRNSSEFWHLFSYPVSRAIVEADDQMTATGDYRYIGPIRFS